MNHQETKDVPLYLYISGGAGVGKSLLIKAIYMYDGLTWYYNEDSGSYDDAKVLLTAPTGKTAFGIGDKHCMAH